MAFTRYLAEPSVVTFEQRCAACRQWLNRAGPYCTKCVKNRRLKTFFGTVVAVQLAVAAVLVLHPVDWHVTRPVSETTPPAVIPEMTPQAGWVYYDVTDPLIGDVTHHARLVAERPLVPEGSVASAAISHGMLELAVSPHYGTAVLLTFPPMKKTCSANACVVQASFDQQPPIKVPFQDISSERASVPMRMTLPSSRHSAARARR
jgi:hypothetical protein